MSGQYDYLKSSANQQIQRLCYGERWSAFSSLLEEFSRLSLEESAKVAEVEEGADARLSDAIDLAHRFRDAVNVTNRNEPDEKADEKQRKEWARQFCRLWTHTDPTGALYSSIPGDQLRTIDKEELSDVAARYIQRPWLEFGRFEWMIFDALLYAEIVGFAVDWKNKAPASDGYSWLSSLTHKGDLSAMQKEAKQRQFFYRSLGWFTAFVLPGIAIWLSLEFSRGGWWFVIAAGWLALNLVWFAVAWVRRRFAPKLTSKWEQGWNLWGEMRGMYNALPRDAVVSPTAIRKELDKLSARGAVWPGAAVAIIDHAIQRNPATWILNSGSAYP